MRRALIRLLAVVVLTTFVAALTRTTPVEGTGDGEGRAHLSTSLSTASLQCESPTPPRWQQPVDHVTTWRWARLNEAEQTASSTTRDERGHPRVERVIITAAPQGPPARA